MMPVIIQMIKRMAGNEEEFQFLSKEIPGKVSGSTYLEQKFIVASMPIRLAQAHLIPTESKGNLTCTRPYPKTPTCVNRIGMVASMPPYQFYLTVSLEGTLRCSNASDA